MVQNAGRATVLVGLQAGLRDLRSKENPVRKMILLGSMASLLLGGCATKAATGAVVGTAGGAVVGGAIGKVAGSTAKGAIIGAVVGGTAGAIIGAQMDRQAAEIEQTVDGATVERVGEGIQVTFASGLLFDYDSDVVKPDARTNLQSLARSLAKFPDSDVLFIGHTDSDGPDEYNLRLSVRRADAAASYVISQGVAATRVGTLGLGETEPVATNATDAGKATNRRVEVAIYASRAARQAAQRP